ncbi:hypothetical protein SY88_03625 [Clostridiales bacterium PH28_bin88]|nr:hypothetical protein SY88_03625 [Clostridiales bacterium PH28_bin88]
MQQDFVVYVDVVFFINLVMDYLILWAAARFGQLKTNFLRLLVSATAGAVYSLALLALENSVLYSVFARFLFSLVMVVLAYGRLPLRGLLQAVGYFYLVTFVTGGAMLGAIYFANGSPEAYTAMNSLVVFLSNVRYTWLLAAVSAALIVGRWGAAVIKKNFFRSILRVPVIICFGNDRLPVEALIDTGNQLRDPLSKRPVMIVEYSLLKSLLPQELQSIFERNGEPDLQQVVTKLAGSPWAARVRMIPFTSIGRNKGMLLGLRPDEIIVVTEDKPVRVRDVVVGVYHKRLSQDGGYRALLHPDILQTTIGI